MLDQHFDLFHERLKLTKNQREQVKARYTGISKSLYEEFYSGDYNEKTRLIIGSHGKHTEVRHPIGDIDLIFKIPRTELERYQAYKGNGPSALLERVRNKLALTYSDPVTNKKSWGKVVLVDFATGHKVEVLPCYENVDGTFTVPNTEDGGSWEQFDPRAEMLLISESQQKTGITTQLIKYIKRWNNKSGKTIKSFQIEFFCVSFLDTEFDPTLTWSEYVEAFFTWLELQYADLSEAALSRIVTAKNRAQKAREYELTEKYSDACIEFRKVFGRIFPVYDAALSKVKTAEALSPTDEEEWIHDKVAVKINRDIDLEVSATVMKEGWPNAQSFAQYLGINADLPKSASLTFKARSSLGANASYMWKVRNFGKEAKDSSGLRGQIIEGNRQTRQENTLYAGLHYVECYVIQSDVCVAIKRIFVPIGDSE